MVAPVSVASVRLAIGLIATASSTPIPAATATATAIAIAIAPSSVLSFALIVAYAGCSFFAVVATGVSAGGECGGPN